MEFDIGNSPTSTKFTITMSFEDLLTPGADVGRDSGRCYLGIFKSLENAQDTWFFGNQIMENYYTVFDMTPEDEGRLGYIQIGIQDKISTHDLYYEEGAFVNIVEDVIDGNGDPVDVDSQGVKIDEPS